jgi:nucleoside 2-deoxyribosyltransferase
MRCFLSYSFETDISVIKKILTENNISYVNPIENLEYGNAIVQTISRQIKDSDFVIAVLDDNTNVPFEIGLAMGGKKPIFVITAEKNENELPIFLTATTYAFAKATDYDKIKYSFDFFLDNLPFKKDKIVSEVLEVRTKTKKEYKGKKLTNDYVHSLGNIDNIRGLEFENFIGELFRKLDLDIFAQNRTKEKDFQADFSLWIDELNSKIGNPIIVETKSTSDQHTLSSAVAKLSDYLKKYNSKVGLLIYSNPSGRQYDNLFSYAPLVISISIQELLQQLTEKTLPEILIHLRNKAIHKEIN